MPVELLDPSQCVCIALRRATQDVTTRYDAHLAPSGLRITMYRLLGQLEAAPSPTISALAERIGLDRSTLGRNLRVLERAGHVSLDGAQDERARKVTLTEKGRAALDTARPLWRSAQEQMLADLGEQAPVLLNILGRFDGTLP